MKQEFNLYEKIENSGLGSCHILQKKKGGCSGEIFLIYSEKSTEHFIVCDGISDEYYLYSALYCKKLETALKIFNEKK